MKNSYRTLSFCLTLLTTLVLVGCGPQNQARSMTEDLEASEIQAYEQAVKEMEAQAMKEMDQDG